MPGAREAADRLQAATVDMVGTAYEKCNVYYLAGGEPCQPNGRGFLLRWLRFAAPAKGPCGVRGAAKCTGAGEVGLTATLTHQMNRQTCDRLDSRANSMDT